MKCFAAYAKDEEIRKLGSSGAFFPLISTAYIRNGGIVYASVYDEQLNVKFTRIQDEAHLQASFTSKYVQSQVGDTFCQLAQDLKDGKKVLFCGTSCQVNGLRQYLTKKRISCDQLLLIDIICHGVPSSAVFKLTMNQCYPGCIELNMRNKDLGWDWGSFSWKMRFADGSEQVIPQAKVPHMKAFLSNICLRPSCYQCAAKQEAAADLTLGDFWGISTVNDQIPTRYGVSAVILRTSAGEAAFAAIEQQMNSFEVRYQDIMSHNPPLEHSVAKPIHRNIFLKKLLSDPEVKLEALLSKPHSLPQKVLNKLYQKLPHSGTSVRDLLEQNQQVFYKKKEQCCGCTACYSVCPTNAISMKEDREGFLYAVIDQNKCVNCGACKAVCPFHEK